MSRFDGDMPKRKKRLPKEDLEERERDEPSRTEEEEFRILAELDTDPEELADLEERKRYAEFLKTYNPDA